MDTNAIIANTGIVADASIAVARVRTSPIGAGCVSWERSHASTPVMTTGGVRLLPATDGRLRAVKGASYGTASSFPSSGPSASSPPV
ncbi:hypothetical protein [Kineococcus sp. SYSU DK003]|uniref:hypothetical protein n=1 Tax=Kineococcus sp. SYSU DK003 TaxID=3383124 RepID=UPI003D7E15DF